MKRPARLPLSSKYIYYCIPENKAQGSFSHKRPVTMSDTDTDQDTSEHQHLVGSGDEQEAVTQIRKQHHPLCVAPTRRNLLIMGGGIVLLSVLAASVAYLSGMSASTLVDVTLDCGVVRGTHSSLAYSFKGIPFAKPPVGPLRWRPPQSLGGTSWNGTLDATKFKSMCAQVQPLNANGTVMGSEDCLYLNVWTPSLRPQAKLPVMVWIHGGYLHIFSGSEKGYSPTEEFTAKTNAVHVSFNYRLNAFGFMALPMLREGSPTNTSGNYGFMDQIAALKWVQNNIQAFGGDPAKVTIYGQSSGGTSVWTMMTSPLAKGLFHGAIDMSGSYVYTATMAQAEKDNQIFLKNTGCKDLQCLRALTPDKILKSIPWLGYPSWSGDDLTDLPTKGRLIGPVAIVDGHVLPAPPLEIWEKKMPGYSDVPFVVGTTMQEAEFGPLYSNISSWTEEDFRWQVTKHLDTFGGTLTSEALKLYPLSDFCKQPTEERCIEKAYTTMVSDLRATCPNSDLAGRAAATLSSPVYRYVVTYTPSRPALPSSILPFDSWFSYHILDVFALYGSLNLAQTVTTVADRDFERLVRKYLVHFAKNGAMPPEWPAYPSHTALLATSLTVVPEYYPDRCALWKKNGLFAYAWMN
ncbi:para-nitrobenzyl esterase-like isoform X2 [Lissotriton helveticus]